MILLLIIGLFIGGAAVVFAFQNITTITVSFLSWQLEGTLAVIILLAIASGVLFGALVLLPGTIKKDFQISSLKKQNSKLEKELADKKNEVESEKSKLVANNAYLDDLENAKK